jgi:hypothetical protein
MVVNCDRRWRVVDRQDAPAIRECLERRWLHELMRPSGRLGTLHARCHALARRRACMAFDLLEPERPKVDRAVLDFVKDMSSIRPTLSFALTAFARSIRKWRGRW